MISTTDRLSKLRELMAARGLQAYFVPSEDAHQVHVLVVTCKYLIYLHSLNILHPLMAAAPSSAASLALLAML